MKTWFANFLVCVSQTFNALVLLGNPDETFSARCYRLRSAERWGFWYKTVNRIVFWADDHCADSYAEDISRAGWLLAAHRRASANPGNDGG